MPWNKHATALAALVLAGAVLSGCSGDSDGDGGTGQAALTAFYHQKITWRACPAKDTKVAAPGDQEFTCATIKVPLDYAHPQNATIRLALNRLPAKNAAARIGSLLTNPGGPGESGLEFAYQATDYFSPQMRERYDIIGMDPRGVGNSTRVRCPSGQELERLARKPGVEKAFAESCASRSGRLLDFVGTDNAARDLDVVRSVLGERKLNYYGASYGTLLGQFYAAEFPHSVGRMVLDSVVDPTVWPSDSAGQAVAYDTALQIFVQSCLDKGGCVLGTERAAVIKKIADLTVQLDENPLDLGAGSELTGGELTDVLRGAMYEEEAWPRLEKALAGLFVRNARPMAELLDSSRRGEDEADNGAGTTAIRCLHLRPEERTAAASRQAAQEAVKKAPLFGAVAAAEREVCHYWPAASLANAGRAIAAEGSPTILLVHNTYDGATPIQWARSVEGQLSKARLVTNTSGGHGFYTMGRCTKETVDRFLLHGTLPARDATCHDRAPGVAVPSHR
ncbi:alpha/beta hydrolase [Streptomyces sp. NPDC052676]|uniref:alpha/beta hydrolase n=1 Tax=Streptomyces sp. NPDC052676 TaxID=3154953 RepID=UPI00342ACE71